MCRPQYDLVSSQLLDFYETLGFIVARGDPKKILWIIATISKTQRFCIRIIKEGFLALLLARFSIDIDCSLTVVVYRLHIQVFIISCLRHLIEAKK